MLAIQGIKNIWRLQTLRSCTQRLNLYTHGYNLLNWSFIRHLSTIFRHVPHLAVRDPCCWKWNLNCMAILPCFNYGHYDGSLLSEQFKEKLSASQVRNLSCSWQVYVKVKHQGNNTMHSCIVEELKNSEDREMSKEEWHEIATEFMSLFRENMNSVQTWPAIFLKALNTSRKFQKAHSLYKYITESDIPRTLFIKKTYIELCGLEGFDINQELILKIYNELQEEIDISHCVVAGSIITGLAHTDQWKECLHLLDECEKTASNTKEEGGMSYLKDVYQYIISAAVRARDFKCYCDTFSFVEKYEVVPSQMMYDAVFCVGSDKKEFVNHFLMLMQKYEWIPNERQADTIQEYFEKSMEDGKWRGIISEVKNGLCKVSGHLLSEDTVTYAEFEELRKNFLENCIIGDDIYLSSTPGELRSFNKFIKETGPVDIVLDGLNVSYKKGRRTPHQLPALVNSLVRNYGYKVLVVLRKHGSSKLVEKLSGFCEVFLVDKVSIDDMYVLYAALHSGKHTLIVSRDKMRQHRHLLSDHCKRIFDKWLKSHKIEDFTVGFHGENDEVFIKFPSRHAEVVQNSQFGWHIPVQTVDPKTNKLVVKKWLFLKKL